MGLPVVDGGGWWVQKDAQEDGILNLFPETADNLIMLFPTESAAPPPPGQWNGSTVHFLTFSTIESRADHPPQEPQTKHCVLLRRGGNGGKKRKESGPATFASYGLYVGMWLYPPTLTCCLLVAGVMIRRRIDPEKLIIYERGRTSRAKTLVNFLCPSEREGAGDAADEVGWLAVRVEWKLHKEFA